MTRRKSEAITEADVKAQVKDYLNGINAFWFMPVQMGYGTTSIDFLGCYRGWFFGIETKRPGKSECTGRQARTIKEINEAGGYAFVADSVDMVKHMFECRFENLVARP